MPRSSLWASWSGYRKKKKCENRLRKIPGTKYNFNLSFWSRKQQFFFLKCRLNVEPCFGAQLWRSLEDILFHVWPSADPSGIGYPVSLSQASAFLSKERTKGSILKWVLFFIYSPVDLQMDKWIIRRRRWTDSICMDFIFLFIFFFQSCGGTLCYRDDRGDVNNLSHKPIRMIYQSSQFYQLK